MDSKILVTQSENLKKDISNSVNFWFGLYQTNNPASKNQLKSQLSDRKSTQYKNIYNEIYSDIQKIYSVNNLGKAIEGYSSKYEKNFKTFNHKLSEFSSITADKIIEIIGTGLQGSFNPQKITEAVQKLITERENEFEKYLQKNIGQLENYMILLKGAEDGDVDYKYISESTGACDLCDSLNEQSFKMINAKVGINYPPLHPNCKCRVSALKFGSIIGYSHQPKDIINNLSKLLDNLPYIDKNVKRIEQKNNDEDTLSTLTYPDYHTEYGPFYEYPWVKTTPPTETAITEEEYDIETFMNMPLEERIKLTYGEDEGEVVVYVSKIQSDISSGKIYSFSDLCSLKGKEVNVQNDGQTSHNIIINIEPELFESIIKISIEFQIDPTLILAVMAHESGFNIDATSEAGAVGLMQTMPQWFYDNAKPYKEFIEALGGDYNDMYDPITNIISWSNGLKTWFKIYGETEESLRALRQGYKGSGWTKGAILNGQEFLDIKQQLDYYIFN